ncbi:hypothetical protein AAKU55_003418, partial [Oxalobacteraceae bacterium GrIS 1.11]
QRSESKRRCLVRVSIMPLARSVGKAGVYGSLTSNGMLTQRETTIEQFELLHSSRMQS